MRKIKYAGQDPLAEKTFLNRVVRYGDVLSVSDNIVPQMCKIGFVICDFEDGEALPQAPSMDEE